MDIRGCVVCALLAACSMSDPLSPPDQEQERQKASLIPDKDWSYVGFVSWDTGNVGTDGQVYVAPQHVSVYGGIVQAAVVFSVRSQTGLIDHPYVGRFTNGFVRSYQKYDFYLNGAGVPYWQGQSYGFFHDKPWGISWWELQSNGGFALTMLPGALDTSAPSDGDPDIAFETAYQPAFDETGSYAHVFGINQAFRIGIRRGGMTATTQRTTSNYGGGIALAFDGPVAWIAATQLNDDKTVSLQLWKQAGATAQLEKVAEVQVSAAWLHFEQAVYIWAANGRAVIQGNGSPTIDVYYYDGSTPTLTLQPTPPVASFDVNIARDGAILYGWTDQMSGTVSRVVGGALETVGQAHFTHDAAVPFPYADADGNIYAMFENNDPKGAAIACHGPTCVPYVKPGSVMTPPVVSCSTTANCKESTGYIGVDNNYTVTFEDWCVNQYHGTYAEATCPLDGVAAGCRATDATGIMVTTWYQGLTTAQAMQICTAVKQMFVLPGQ